MSPGSCGPRLPSIPTPRRRRLRRWRTTPMGPSSSPRLRTTTHRQRRSLRSRRNEWSTSISDSQDSTRNKRAFGSRNRPASRGTATLTPCLALAHAQVVEWHGAQLMAAEGPRNRVRVGRRSRAADRHDRDTRAHPPHPRNPAVAQALIVAGAMPSTVDDMGQNATALGRARKRGHGSGTYGRGREPQRAEPPWRHSPRPSQVGVPSGAQVGVPSDAHDARRPGDSPREVSAELGPTPGP